MNKIIGWLILSVIAIISAVWIAVAGFWKVLLDAAGGVALITVLIVGIVLVTSEERAK